MSMLVVTLREEHIPYILSKDDVFFSSFVFTTPAGKEVEVNFDYISARLYMNHDNVASLELHCDEMNIDMSYIDDDDCFPMCKDPYEVIQESTLVDVFNEVYINGVEEPFSFDLWEAYWDE